MGTKDQWEAATMGYQNIGPNYWKGEEGRLALIAGTEKLTDPQWVAPFSEAGQVEGLPGRRLRGADLSRTARTCSRSAAPRSTRPVRGKSPASTTQADFKMGAFPPPVPKAGDTCYISDHTDIGMGMNAKLEASEAAKKFLQLGRLAGIRQIYANALPGFFPLTNDTVTMKDPLAQEFVSWRETCKSTIRSTYPILSRGTPNLENETWTASANVINGTETPEAGRREAAGGPRQLVQAGRNVNRRLDPGPGRTPGRGPATARMTTATRQDRGEHSDRAAPTSADRRSAGTSPCSWRRRCWSTRPS